MPEVIDWKTRFRNSAAAQMNPKLAEEMLARFEATHPGGDAVFSNASRILPTHQPESEAKGTIASDDIASDDIASIASGEGSIASGEGLP